MKILLTLFVLFFSSSVLAEDISDFEIEGFRIGDSLLDYFSEEEIKENIIEVYDYYEDQSFTTVEFDKHPLLKNYNAIQFNFKRSDKSYKIYSISTGDFFYDGIDKCIKKLNEISESLSSIYKNTRKESVKKQVHPADPDGQSFGWGDYFIFDTGDRAVVECYDWSEKITKEMGYTDRLGLSLDSKEFVDWLWQ